MQNPDTRSRQSICNILRDTHSLEKGIIYYGNNDLRSSRRAPLERRSKQKTSGRTRGRVHASGSVEDHPKMDPMRDAPAEQRRPLRILEGPVSGLGGKTQRTDPMCVGATVIMWNPRPSTSHGIRLRWEGACRSGSTQTAWERKEVGFFVVQPLMMLKDDFPARTSTLLTDHLRFS